MSQNKVARVYSTALYEAAVEEGRVDEVGRDLGDFVEAVKTTPELRQFLLAEEASDARKKDALMELTEGGDELVRNLLRIVVDKNRESELVGIYEGFIAAVEEAEGIVHVEVVSAVPMPDELQSALKAKIESSLQKTIELSLSVDEELLGGLKLRIGDRVADASVRYRLDKLRKLLTSPMASLEGTVEAAS